MRVSAERLGQVAQQCALLGALIFSAPMLLGFLMGLAPLPEALETEASAAVGRMLPDLLLSGLALTAGSYALYLSGDALQIFEERRREALGIGPRAVLPSRDEPQ